MPVETVRQAGLRKKRKALLYDLDLLNLQVLIRIDLIIEDGNTNILTPVTNLYSARFTADNASAIPKRIFEPRALECCFNYQNQTQVIRTVFNPYNPNNSSFLLLIKELLNYNSIVGLTYIGESKDKEVEKWL